MTEEELVKNYPEVALMAKANAFLANAAYTLALANEYRKLGNGDNLPALIKRLAEFGNLMQSTIGSYCQSAGITAVVQLHDPEFMADALMAKARKQKASGESPLYKQEEAK